MEPDTIVAPATPRGISALALVRLSGPDALPILSRLVPNVPPDPQAGSYVGWILDPGTGDRIDHAVSTVFRAPSSYTGQDTVEFSTHGGTLIPGLLVDACVRLGARLAEAGEFTRRAYLGGKLDLVQAEAVIDLIESHAPAQHRAALGHLDKGLSDRLAALRTDLVRLEASLVHHLDFPEEDDPPIPVDQIAQQGEAVAEALELLLRSAPEGELLREGALAVLAGRPNSGKSSLFNLLVGRDRAIVTEEPGTTRDAIEAPIAVDGFPFIVVDTAGLRRTRSPIETLGIEVAERYLAAADLVIFCVEPEGTPELGFIAERSSAPIVLARTKADLVSQGARTEVPSGTAPTGSVEPAAEIWVSSVTGVGVHQLKQAIARCVFRGLTRENGTTLLVRKRQAEGVAEAHEEVRRFVDALRNGVPPEVASTHLRPAESALEELLGVISTEDVLERVFREFCVGK